MQYRAVPSNFVEIHDPASLWHGRLGHIARSEATGTWWVDHLTGTEVFFPNPRLQEAMCST